VSDWQSVDQEECFKFLALYSSRPNKERIEKPQAGKKFLTSIKEKGPLGKKSPFTSLALGSLFSLFATLLDPA